MYKIFIVEDDKKIKEELSFLLKKYGYDSDVANNLQNVTNEILNSNPDLILLDINLPVYDGYYVFREIKKKMDVPIIMVTSRDSELDELISMNLGADDFITKPYNKDILLARINSVIRRVYKNRVSAVMEYEGVKLDMLKGIIRYLDKEVDLTKNEIGIMKILFENKGTIVSRNDIINSLWQSDEFIDDNTLTVNITRLRKKMECIGIFDFIKTKRGMGYMI